MALFSGNDFLDVLAHGEQAGALQVPDRPVGYRESLGGIGTIQGEPYAGPGQGLNQAFFFRHFPHLERVSLMTVQRNLSELAERCRSDSTALLIVVLPTLLDVEWEHDGLRNTQPVKAHAATVHHHRLSSYPTRTDRVPCLPQTFAREPAHR